MADKPQRYIILTDPGKSENPNNAPLCQYVKVLRSNWLRLGRPRTIAAYIAASARIRAPQGGKR